MLPRGGGWNRKGVGPGGREPSGGVIRAKSERPGAWAFAPRPALRSPVRRGQYRGPECRKQTSLVQLADLQLVCQKHHWSEPSALCFRSSLSLHNAVFLTLKNSHGNHRGHSPILNGDAEDIQHSANLRNCTDCAQPVLF